MATQISGVVRGTRLIEVNAPLPYQDGVQVALEIHPATHDVELDAADMLQRLGSVIGIAHSGLTDISENKHRYLAAAYDKDRDQGLE